MNNKLKQLFDTYDSDKDGILNSSQCKRLMNVINSDVTEMNKNDQSNDKVYSYNDVLKMINNLNNTNKKDNNENIYTNYKTHLEEKYDEETIRIVLNDICKNGEELTLNDLEAHFRVD